MRRRLILGGLAAAAWLGCAAVAGLDDFEIVPANDAGTAADVVVADRASLPDAPVTEIEDASADADAALVVVDAGPCAKCLHTARALCVANACTQTYRVFVSHAGFGANLGGVDGGDTLCQNAANAAGLGGTWRAWLSAPDAAPPRGRFTLTPTLPYRLLDGTIVVGANTDALGTKPFTLDASISIDETGANISDGGQLEVWTGTTGSGDISQYTCDGWTSNVVASLGAVGVLNQTSGNWTDIYPQFCDRTGTHLYCFEQ